MMTLYVKTGCPYSARALEAIKEMGIVMDIKNVADEGVADEMIRIGGERQEPFLVDEERGVSMYESESIINYLKQRT